MKTEIIEIIEAAQNSAAKGDFKSVLYNNIVIRDSLHFALRDAKQELFPARR